MDPVVAVPAALRRHRTVREVTLVGSRAEGRAHELSDWDFSVSTDSFPSVAHDLPTQVASLGPLSELWDPYSDHACYMLMLRGPTKVDLIFPSESRDWAGPWKATPETLPEIDRHFWDWILWLEQKRRGARTQQLEKSLADMFQLLLRPTGVADQPTSVSEALTSYLVARAALERRFGVEVPRELEREVRPILSEGPERL